MELRTPHFFSPRSDQSDACQFCDQRPENRQVHPDRCRDCGGMHPAYRVAYGHLVYDPVRGTLLVPHDGPVAPTAQPPAHIRSRR